MSLSGFLGLPPLITFVLISFTFLFLIILRTPHPVFFPCRILSFPLLPGFRCKLNLVADLATPRNGWLCLLICSVLWMVPPFLSFSHIPFLALLGYTVINKPWFINYGGTPPIVIIWYLDGTLLIEQPRGLLIQGWHYQCTVLFFFQNIKSFNLEPLHQPCHCFNWTNSWQTPQRFQITGAEMLGRSGRLMSVSVVCWCFRWCLRQRCLWDGTQSALVHNLEQLQHDVQHDVQHVSSCFKLDQWQKWQKVFADFLFWIFNNFHCINQHYFVNT